MREISKSDRNYYAKAKDLLKRVKDKAKNGVNISKQKSAQIRATMEANKVNKQRIKAANEYINQYLPYIENNEYAKVKLRGSMDDFKKMLKEDPIEAAHMIGDFAFIARINEFALKDPIYTDEKFDGIAIDVLDLLDDNSKSAEDILKKINESKITEGQIEFLTNTIKEQMKELEEKEKKEKEEEEKTLAAGGTTINKKKRKTSYGGFVSISNKSATRSNATAPTTGSSEPPKDEPSVEVVNPTVEREKKRVAEIDAKFEEEKKKLYDDLDEYEKAFIDDAHAEGLEPGDEEFEQMLHGRTVNRDRILLYYVLLSELKYKSAYEKLSDYDKMFVDDAHAEGLEPGDNEFDQMMNERTVNKQAILNYIKFKAENVKLRDKAYSISNKLDKQNDTLYDQKVEEIFSDESKTLEEKHAEFDMLKDNPAGGRSM